MWGIGFQFASPDILQMERRIPKEIVPTKKFSFYVFIFEKGCPKGRLLCVIHKDPVRTYLFINAMEVI